MAHRQDSGISRSAAPIRFVSAALILIGLCGCASFLKNSPSGAASQVHKPISLPEPGPPPLSLSPTGSLWAPTSGSLYADIKASKIGDILTITISESASGSKASATTNAKTNTFQGSLTFAGAGVGTSGVANPKGALTFGPYNGSFSSGFNGSGSTSQTDTMTAYITATVIDVLPNGNLVIRGSRWTKINDELQQIVLEGVVRPYDITNTNTVLSQNVAEAKIYLLGKGPVSRYQKPGWLGQLWDFVSPF